MVTDVNILGDGKHIVLDFPSLGDAMSLWKPWGDGNKRTEITAMMHQALAAAGLSLEVRVNGKAVVQLGGTEMTGLMLALLARRMSA